MKNDVNCVFVLRTIFFYAVFFSYNRNKSYIANYMIV